MRKSYGRLIFEISTKALWGFSLFFVCIFISWTALVKANFNYDFWYEQLNIDSTIKYYAPQNHAHKDFIDTEKNQHYRLFAEIVEAITSNPEKLEQIEYITTKSPIPQPMLTKDEITHLRDVHLIISIFSSLGYKAIIASLTLTLMMFILNIPPPKTLPTLGVAALMLAAAGLIIFIHGPVEVFYQLHIAIFPDGHKWFFYYDESLMSMIMQAPNIFGYIGVTLALIASTIFIILLFILRKFYYQIRNESGY